MKRAAAIFLTFILSIGLTYTVSAGRIGAENSADPYAYVYTGRHVIYNYQERHSSYVPMYYLGFGTPMDGRNYMADMIIPGLSREDNMIPQGITYYPAKNQILISAYYKNVDTSDPDYDRIKAHERPSVIFAINFDTGRLEAVYNLYRSDGSSSYSHVSGIAVSENYLYITNGSKIAYVPLSELNAGTGTQKNLFFTGSFDFKPYLNASSAYLSFSGGTLWTGNFFDESAQGLNVPAADGVNSRVIGYRLNGFSSYAEINDLLTDGKVRAPDHIVDLPDGIKHVQGATVADDTLFLSASYSRRNEGDLYYAPLIFAEMNPYMTDYKRAAALPMAENLAEINGYLYTVTESASWFFYGYTPTFYSKSPTDVIWRIDYKRILNDEGYTEGDVDGNGLILAEDARLALRFSAGLEYLDETARKAADVDGSGIVLADDARQILRFSAKLQHEFEKVNY